MHVVKTLTSNPYEPDIVLKDRSNKHILIDIEIDEPYDLSSRVPTHCLGRDNKRDDFFSRRGWVVVRFTEYQIVTQINECCAVRILFYLLHPHDTPPCSCGSHPSLAR